MRNGLTKALAALAIACLGYQAFASAPVIREIPSPVITNDALPVTGTNLFVYADFINLNSFTSDDGDPANLIWSFSDGNAVTHRYNMNGARAINLSTESPVTPPAATVINSSSNISSSGEFNPDNNIVTPTIRDIVLSPFGGPNVATGAAAGSIRGFGTLVLFASDGTTQSLGRSFVAYSVEAGPGGLGDRLSATPVPPFDHKNTFDFTTGVNGWTQGSTLGSVLTSGATGLCTAVTASGVNIGEWVSPYQIIALQDFSVYRIRATMSTNQNTAGSVPLWDIYMQNLDSGSSGAPQSYAGDYFFLDNTGSANAVKGPGVGLNVFDMWYTPAAVRTPQWRNATTGAFAAARDAANDMRLVFRVLDVDGSGYNAEADSGQICLTNLSIDRFDLNNEYSTTLTGGYSLNPIVNGINGVSVQDVLAGLGAGTGSNKDFATAPLTITPQDPNGWKNEITVITPGDTNNPALSDPSYGTGAAVVDNYPVNWAANTLYELVVEASAPDAVAENNGPDALLLGIDTKTIEVFADSYALVGFPGSPGMPKMTTTVGGTQIYSMFLWSHNRTLSATPEAGRIRYRVEVLNTENFNRTDSSPTPGTIFNKGGVRIHSIQMRLVKFYSDGQP